MEIKSEGKQEIKQNKKTIFFMGQSYISDLANLTKVDEFSILKNGF